MCLASKYTDAIPLKDIKSESIVEALLLTFGRFGIPRKVSCDLGSCFTSNLTSTFLEKFGINVRHSSVHHTEGNPKEQDSKTFIKSNMPRKCARLRKEFAGRITSVERSRS
ncbi:hypothetical protein AVEN_96650-1 [Araneus ventricosus]|uniref:Integrase catalytic domain-containing protein n=1 Tax=Araneus ventricosus TaxID=182803 RepID=A0A4Y2E9P1_ARAVE|nr:hypothetical protein AVEN_96650-1 [Araneus ventricosus]